MVSMNKRYVNGSIMGELYILGTKVLAEELFAVAEHAGIAVAGFVENEDKNKAGTLLCERPIIWVDEVPRGARCVCALSTMKRRFFISQLEGKVEYVNLVHPSSIILPRTTLGEGTIVSCGVIIASNAKVGRHVFLNRGVRVGHHTSIGDFVAIQPGANIAGMIEVGDATYIGMGAVIIERLRIGRESIIAAGAVVTKDVPDHVLVAGNPAIIKKENIDAK
jgi:sugar O-acyltransferase (sialic acid O-acetyltransferase NeuD family)